MTSKVKITKQPHSAQARSVSTRYDNFYVWLVKRDMFIGKR